MGFVEVSFNLNLSFNFICLSIKSNVRMYAVRSNVHNFEDPYKPSQGSYLLFIFTFGLGSKYVRIT